MIKKLTHLMVSSVVLCGSAVAAQSDTDFSELACGADTVELAIECMRPLLSDEDHNSIVNASFDELGLYHFGLGLWLRNNWGLWSGESQLAKSFHRQGVQHPDEMSTILIEAYWSSYQLSGSSLSHVMSNSNENDDLDREVEN